MTGAALLLSRPWTRYAILAQHCLKRTLPMWLPDRLIMTDTFTVKAFI
jgi:hypothetical protein